MSRAPDRCYLAGPMSPDETWRDEARSELEHEGLEVFTPEFLEVYVERFDVSEGHAAKILTDRDRRFASTSEFVLANFTGATSRSLGTAVELGWADNGFTTTVAVMPDGCQHEFHPIIRSVCQYIVPELDDALNIIGALTWKNVLMPLEAELAIRSYR